MTTGTSGTTDACATCAPIGEEIHHEAESPVAIPERDLLERLTDTLWRCPACGAVFRYKEWTPGGSEDFQRTWYNARLARLPRAEADAELRNLVAQQHISIAQARRLGLAVPAEVAGESAPLQTSEVTWIALPPRKHSSLVIDPPQDALFVTNAQGQWERRSLATGERSWVATVPAASYTQAALSPQGTCVAISGSNVTLTLLDATTGAARAVALPQDNEANYVPAPVWFADSLVGLAVNNWHHPPVAFFVDAVTAEVMWTTPDTGLRKILGSHDGALLALWWFVAGSGGRNRVDLVEPRTGHVRLSSPAPFSPGIAWAPDDKSLLLAGAEVVMCLDLSGRAWRWQDDHEMYTNDPEIRVSPDGALAAFRLGDRGLLVRDVGTGAVQWRRPAVHPKKLSGFAWTADGAHVVTAGVDHEGSSLRAWDRKGRWANSAALPQEPTSLERRGDLLVASPMGDRLPIWRV